MTLPEARALLDRALTSPRGIEIQCDSPGAANALYMNLHKCRSMERKRNSKIFSPGEPLYGATAWDDLVIKRIMSEAKVTIVPSFIVEESPRIREL